MKRTTAGWAVSLLMGCGSCMAAEKTPSLEGTWVLEAADTLRPDGSRVQGYGERPQGRLMVDRDGRYSLQIYRREARSFASGDKGRGTPDEYREAVMRISAHTGRVRLDPASGTIVFDVAQSLFPNWEGKRQVREYELKGAVLTYRVPASATGNGTVAISQWRKE